MWSRVKEELWKDYKSEMLGRCGLGLRKDFEGIMSQKCDVGVVSLAFKTKHLPKRFNSKLIGLD